MKSPGQRRPLVEEVRGQEPKSVKKEAETIRIMEVGVKPNGSSRTLSSDSLICGGFQWVWTHIPLDH